MSRLLLTSGRGPVECRIALAKTLAALLRDAARAGIEADCITARDPDGNGPASAIVVLNGTGAESLASSWTGTIQWIATSPVRPHHKRKNWFVGIAPLASVSAPPQAIDVRDVRCEAFSAGGPGGQHQNKTASAVRAVHVPTGLTVVAREERSQHQNRRLAVERLGVLIAMKGELEARHERERVQAAHDLLERGRPVKCFTGAAFEPA